MKVNKHCNHGVQEAKGETVSRRRLGLTQCEANLTQADQPKYLDDELSLERSLPVRYGRVERSYILLIYLIADETKSKALYTGQDSTASSCLHCAAIAAAAAVATVTPLGQKVN